MIGAKRRTRLLAALLTVGALDDNYAIAMPDPGGNEFDINSRFTAYLRDTRSSHGEEA